MNRHTLPEQKNPLVTKGYYDPVTGEVRIQLDLPPILEGTTNTALIVDGSGSMSDHFKKGKKGWGFFSSPPEPSDVEKFIHRAGKQISEMDSDHGVQVYLCCLDDGTVVHDLGNKYQKDLELLNIDVDRLGHTLGSNTYLLPALRKAVQEVVLNSGCTYGLIALVTDGQFHDMPQIKSWAIDLAHKIESGKHPLTKIVMIGFDDASGAQMEELDNLETGTEIDIFNALAVKTLWDAMEKLDSETINTGQKIASSGYLEANGKQILKFESGVPQRIDAKISARLKLVTVVLQDQGQEMRIDVVLQ